MSDKAFAKMMGQIAAEAEAEKVREIKDANRRRVIARVKSVSVFLFGAALLTTGYFYRDNLQKFTEEKFLKKPQVGKVEGSTGQALQGIQSAAQKRDQVLEQITQK